jgi:hypothetical protein
MYNTEQFNKDLIFGLEEENNIKNILENHFNIKLKQPKNKFKSYDLKGKNIRIEIKTRRIKSTDYNTTLLCKSKLDYYLKKSKKKIYIIVFNYIDKIYFIEFNDELYNLPLKKYKISRGDIVNNIEIDINKLKLILNK